MMLCVHADQSVCGIYHHHHAVGDVRLKHAEMIEAHGQAILHCNCSSCTFFRRTKRRPSQMLPNDFKRTASVEKEG